MRQKTRIRIENFGTGAESKSEKVTPATSANYWILHQENRNELIFQVEANFNTSAKLTKTILLMEKYFAKTVQNTACTSIKPRLPRKSI